MSKSLFELEDVGLTTAGATRLERITLSIAPGVTAVIGPSGSGKTSLLNLLVQFEQPSAGKLICNGNHKAGAIPIYWAPHEHGLWPHLTAAQHLAAVSPSEARLSVEALLEAFDLTDVTGRRPNRLSQGQRARLATARCLAAEPAVMVMDESLANVDSLRAQQCWRAVREHIAATGCSLIFSTHSPQAVLADAQQVICLDAGRLLYHGEAATLYDQPADEKLAACLGPSNWFEPSELSIWLNQHDDQPRCVRPERLQIGKSADGAFVVEQSRFLGGMAQVWLRHESTQARRQLLHRPSGDHLKPGDRAAVSLINS